ncbi:hypothetical protein KAW48_02715 [candidate division WOR-3 bacterium]|nr:hypothetical protein [candidate division WOR-3 bacterium]
MKGSQLKWLAIGSCLCIIILIIVCLSFYSKTFPGVSRESGVVMDTYKQTALNISVVSSNSLASLAILILTGAWGLILSSSRKNNIRGWDWYTIGAGSLALFFSYWSYRFFLYKHIEILYQVKTIDLTAPIANFWSLWQIIFFIAGFVTFAVFFYKSNQERGKV